MVAIQPPGTSSVMMMPSAASQSIDAARGFESAMVTSYVVSNSKVGASWCSIEVVAPVSIDREASTGATGQALYG